MADMGRRRTMQLLAGLGAGALGTGCCLFRGRVRSRPSIQSPFPELGRIRPILRPAPSAARRAVPKHALDAHAHFFNASDVNVKGYLEKCIAHGFQPEKFRKYIARLGGVAEALNEAFAPTAAEEFGDLLAMLNAPSVAASGEARGVLERRTDDHTRRLSERLAEELNRRGLHTTFFELRSDNADAVGVLSGSAQGRPAPRELTPDDVLEAAIPGRREVGIRELDAARWAPPGAPDPRGPLAFLWNILSPRWHQLQAYGHGYTTGARAFGIDGVFGALVDFDRWLGCASRSARRDQMQVLSLLSAMSGGYLLPLISYNPWTDIEEQEASMQLVKEAVTRFGFVGVKIYPPVGYRPYGNAQDYPTKLAHPDLVALDDRLLTFFTWCADHGVPVMAHTAESMGRDDASDELGGPAGWKALLARAEHDGMKGLVINAGHLGGAQGKAPAAGGPAWPEALLGLSRPGATVFGDLGYWDALGDKDQRVAGAAAARLRRALAVPGAGGRIMFGTDWFMLSQVRWWPEYPGILADRIADVAGESLPLDQLFFTNAVACFGLGRGGTQRGRVVERLRAMPGGLPAWLEAAGDG